MSRRLTYLLLMIFSAVVTGCTRKAKLPDLTETYSSKDTKPFGGKVAFRLIENSLPNNFVQLTKLPFENGLETYDDTASLYFCISKYFFASEQEVSNILDFVYDGNTFFLASSRIDTNLLQKIYCKVQRDIAGFDPSTALYNKTSIKLIEGIDSAAPSSFSYFYRPFASHFTEINDNYCRTVGYNGNDEVNCLVFFWGKGKMFLHTDPRAFSNYFLLKDNNHLYMQQLLQLMDPEPEHVYWNDYYYNNNSNKESNSFSTMSQIMKHPPLEAAFWLALLLLLLYVLFGRKRKQRIIDVVEPNQNSSVAFTETIARLYLQKKDNKNIAEKMITYFNEYIRNNYFLYANFGSDDFIQALSRKSGVSLEKTAALYHAIDHATHAEKLDDFQLLSLNEQVQQFYKKRK